MNLGGSLTRQIEADYPVGDGSPHIVNIDRMVEDMENKIRNTLNDSHNPSDGSFAPLAYQPST